MKQRYDSYKSSGIDWIGEIPSHWELLRMRFLCDMITGDKDTVNKVDDGNYPFYVRSPQIERINSYSFDGEAVLMAGDGVGAGKVVHYTNGKFDFHQRVYNFHNFKGIKGILLYYYLKTLFKYKIEEGGAKNTVDSVRQPWLKDFPICVPPLAEQEAIAAWLDEKCGEIDAAIAKVDRELELIDELKQSEISRVVTRGLDPTAPLRPSGIDWIGEIPEHWRICLVKHKYSIQTGFTPATKIKEYYDAENGFIWITIGDMKDNVISDSVNKVSSKYIEEFKPQKTPKGSLLYSFKLSVGQVAFAGVDLYTNEAIASFLQSKSVNLNFLKYSSSLIINNANINIYGAPIMNQELIKNAPIVFPPLKEQEEIAAYLDKKCADIDGLKAKLVKKRATLKELRQAIISEVVTGKRKVI